MRDTNTFGTGKCSCSFAGDGMYGDWVVSPSCTVHRASYPGLDDVEFEGQLAIEFITRPASGPTGWQKRVTKSEREELIRSQATLAAHLANIYTSR